MYRRLNFYDIPIICYGFILLLVLGSAQLSRRDAI
jgi:hypothetical protein